MDMETKKDINGACVEWCTDNLVTILAENQRRKAAEEVDYDPISGLNATGRRVKVKNPLTKRGMIMLPEEMVKELIGENIQEIRPKRKYRKTKTKDKSESKDKGVATTAKAGRRGRAKAKSVASSAEEGEVIKVTVPTAKDRDKTGGNKKDECNKSNSITNDSKKGDYNKNKVGRKKASQAGAKKVRKGAIELPEWCVGDPEEWHALRFRHDFEYWAATCVRIRHKLTGQMVPFVLNRPQRRVLGIIEEQRKAGKPLRLIMLKARQWGGSTLVQMYFAWIQIVHRRNWHSLICAHVKDTSANIRGMYSAMLVSYPKEYWYEEEAPEFKSFERSVNIRLIAGRDCRVTLASSENQESSRGLDCSMAHLSEVAFWKATDQKSPEDFVRAVCSGIPREPYTFVALESTANGVGNYFHTEWIRAMEGRSDKAAVFVPWHEIEIYRTPVTDPLRLISEADEYEQRLWRSGVTLEAIQWYHDKRRENASHEAMKAEYPTDPIEAFTNTGSGVFDSEWIERLRADCREAPMTGDIVARQPWGHGALCDIRFSPGKGNLKVWDAPAADACYVNRYVVAVDIGGRSAKSDYSVIAVIDRMGGGRGECKPSIAAQWRGHMAHDLLPWKAAMIARWYHDALLVVESNSLETDADENATFALSELNTVYPNMYVRTPLDSSGMPRRESKVGFHTNVNTKSLVITYLVRMVRETAYTERDPEACNELATYEKLQGGGYAARRGYHDDILMTRAIGLYVASTIDYPPERIAIERGGERGFGTGDERRYEGWIRKSGNDNSQKWRGRW